MGRFKKSKWLDLSIFSVQITYLAIIIVVAVIISVLKPMTIYIDLVIILITALFCIYTCIKEIKSRRYRINELSKSVDIVLVM
jgi:peptidoglycan/LPS O-acetylase OafA/YrhL